MSERAYQIKQTRRFILQSLNILYPQPMQWRSLLRTVLTIHSQYDHDLLAKDLAYLEERGYIQIDRKNMFGDPAVREDWLIRLTAKGSDVSNDIARDPALEI